MKYRLFFGNWEIASVTQLDEDFPNVFGRFHLLEGVRLNPELTRLIEFIDYYLRTSSIRNEERFDELDPAEEMAFIDLIESDKWILVDALGATHSILTPIFDQDGTLVWRWR